MAWGASGKYWNVGLSEPGRQDATRKQLWYLHLLSGRKIDYRGRGLTRDEAASLIDKLKKEQNEAGRDLVMRDAYFAALFQSAVEVANEAGADWMSKHSKPLFSIFDPKTQRSIDVYDRIGDIYIPWPKDSVFGAWLKRNSFNGQYSYVFIPHNYHGQLEYGLQKATVESAHALLSKSIPGLRVVYNDFWT